jgi:glyoxylase-like metal-dependent hydrolase (beta-lactamase superfamily II)
LAVACSEAGLTFVGPSSPAEALSLLRVDPEDATVVLTHAHYDHAGNRDLFPGSKVIVAAGEYEFWTGPFAGRHQYHLLAEDEDVAQLRWVHADGRLQLSTKMGQTPCDMAWKLRIVAGLRGSI